MAWSWWFNLKPSMGYCFIDNWQDFQKDFLACNVYLKLSLSWTEFPWVGNSECLAVAAFTVFSVKENHRRFPGLGKAALLGIWHFSWNRKPTIQAVYSDMVNFNYKDLFSYFSEYTQWNQYEHSSRNNAGSLCACYHEQPMDGTHVLSRTLWEQYVDVIRNNAGEVWTSYDEQYTQVNTKIVGAICTHYQELYMSNKDQLYEILHWLEQNCKNCFAICLMMHEHYSECYQKISGDWVPDKSRNPL